MIKNINNVGVEKRTWPYTIPRQAVWSKKRKYINNLITYTTQQLRAFCSSLTQLAGRCHVLSPYLYWTSGMIDNVTVHLHYSHSQYSLSVRLSVYPFIICIFWLESFSPCQGKHPPPTHHTHTHRKLYRYSHTFDVHYYEVKNY